MKNDNLIQWLADGKSAAYFGKSFSIRADVLASVITGQGNWPGISQSTASRGRPSIVTRLKRGQFTFRRQHRVDFWNL